jgi:hypothetical protein
VALNDMVGDGTGRITRNKHYKYHFRSCKMVRDATIYFFLVILGAKLKIEVLSQDINSGLGFVEQLFRYT